jgi:serine/threonine-protein kinase
MSENKSISYLSVRKRVSKYPIQQLIERGSETEVYRALHPDLKRTIAIQIYYPNIQKTPEMAACFRQAGKSLAALKHPNIARVFDYGIDNDVYFIATELLATGLTLRDLLSTRRGGLPREEALRLFTQIASAVAYAHDQGVIHGHIKPDIIVLDDSRRPVLFNFYVDCVPNTEPAAPGTPIPAYTPPEQSSPTKESDVYALGVLLYELVTGDVPYLEPISASAEDTSPKPPSLLRIGIDPNIDAVILKALNKRPVNRYPNARALLHELEKSPEISQYETVSLGDEEAQEIRKRRAEVRQFQRTRATETLNSADEIRLSSGWVIIGVLVIILALIIIGTLVL